MHAISLVLALLLTQTPTASEVQGSIELVETFPSETTLDQPDLRETHVVWPELIGAAEERLDMAWFYVSDVEGSRLGATLDAMRAVQGTATERDHPTVSPHRFHPYRSSAS